MMDAAIDVAKAAKLRLAVARFGEMDRAKWWNTKGMLANLGEMAISRGFPKTHLFARARAVFAVAGQRCDEIYNPPDGFTLWRLPPEIEDQIEDTWSHWLEDPDPWQEFLGRVNGRTSQDLLDTRQSLELIDDQLVDRVKKLKRANDFRSVLLPASTELDNEGIALLAAAFFRGEPGKLAVPYLRRRGSEA